MDELKPARGRAQVRPRPDLRPVVSAERFDHRASSSRAAPTAPARVGPSATITVGAGGSSEHLFRRLLGAYLSGGRQFSVIDLPEVTASTSEVVRTFCERTRGTWAVAEAAATLHLVDLTDERSVLLSGLLRRMGRLVLALHRDAVDRWDKLPLGDDDDWTRRDDVLDREAWYLERVVAQRLDRGAVGSELLGRWAVARSLERIADHGTVLGSVGRRLADLPRGAGPLTSLRQLHAEAMEHLEGALAARDGAAANELLDVGEALLESGRALSRRLVSASGDRSMSPATAAAVARTLDSIVRTVAYA